MATWTLLLTFLSSGPWSDSFSESRLKNSGLTFELQIKWVLLRPGHLLFDDFTDNSAEWPVLRPHVLVFSSHAVNLPRISFQVEYLDHSSKPIN